MRQKDGSFHPVSSGTFINKAGKATHIYLADIHTKILDTWKSPEDRSGLSHPLGSHHSSQKLKLDVNASLPDQELDTTKSTKVVYWEGAVDITAPRRGKGHYRRGILRTHRL